MHDFLADVRFTIRQLKKHPGFALVALLSLALGIGANTTVFSVVSAVFLNPLPFEEPHEVVNVFVNDANNVNSTHRPMAVDNTKDLIARSRSFEHVSMVGGTGFTVVTPDRDPEQIAGQMVSANYFDLLGVQAGIGRTFRPEEDQEGAGQFVAVLSHSIWVRLYGEDPGIIGQTISLNGSPFEVIGITPEGFKGTSSLANDDLIWIPFNVWNQFLPPNFHIFYQDRRALAVFPLARLADGVTLEQAQSELTGIAAQLEQEYPEANRDRTFSVVSTVEAAVGINQRDMMTRASAVLMSVVGLVLLIACANLANLLLARSATRAQELSLRAALGAKRRRLVQQLLTESLLIAGAGGLLGLALAKWGAGLLWTFRPTFLPGDTVIPRLDLKVMGFCALITIGTGLLFGLLPAIRASRADVHGMLKGGGRSGAAGMSKSFLRSGLVTAEVALALVGLIGAGLFVRSMQEAQEIDPGFATDGLFVLSVVLSDYSPQEAEQYRQLAFENIGAIPGVTHTAASSTIPLFGPQPRTMIPEGAVDDRSTYVGTVPVTASYFETLDISAQRGRVLNDLDRADTRAVAVVNQAAAERYWPNEDPIGKRFSFYGDQVQREVVGVVPNTALSNLGGPAETAVYLPLTQWHQGFLAFHVRSSVDPSQVVELVRQELQAVDPTLAIQNILTMEDIMGQTLWARRMGAVLLGIFGLLALVLAGSGTYGVMAYISTQRTKEMGIRMALRADRGSVIGLVVKQGMTLAGAAVALGLLAAWVAGRTVEGMLYGVEATDPFTFLAVPGVLLLVALGACAIPAIRSTRMGLVQTLRED